MQKIKETLLRFGRFLKRHKWSVLLSLLALFVAGFIIWDNLSFQGKNNLGEIKIKRKPKVETVRDPLSGRFVSKEVAEKTPIAIVVENHTDARPQSGLNQAAIVYETLAEGGITRFLAIFHDQESNQIGPVRSARPYFVDWALSYKAFFAHVGGNSNALTMIPRLGVYDINQFNFGSYFWRDRSRFAPHNVYTTTEKLISAAKTKKYPQANSNITAYKFKNDEKEELRGVNSVINIRINSTYGVAYTYSKKDNYFYRSIRGVKHTDRVTGEQIRAKNVLICFSNITPGKSTSGEQMMNIRTTGTGNAIFYIDGKKTTGTWKRNGTNVIKFYDAEDKEIKLNAGTSWIEFIPIGTIVN